MESPSEAGPGRRVGEGCKASTSSTRTLSESLEGEEEADKIRGAIALFHLQRGRLELGLALLRPCTPRLKAKVLGLLLDREREDRDVRLRWQCLREVGKTNEDIEQELRTAVEEEVDKVVVDGSVLLSSLARAQTRAERNAALGAILSTGSLELIQRAEAEEDKRYVDENPGGLLTYIERNEAWQEEAAVGKDQGDHTALLQLTRLHNELIHGCLIQAALRDTGQAKSVLRGEPELHAVFLAMLWDETEDLGELERVFGDFGAEGVDEVEERQRQNTVKKLWNTLRHRLLLSLQLGRKVSPHDTKAQLLSHGSLALVEGWPTYSTKQRVKLHHDLNVYHIQAFILAFFKAFSLTNVTFVEGAGDGQDDATKAQQQELDALLGTMREHVGKTKCSFSLTWMAWFCYVFLNCRYHENMSSWRAYASTIYEAKEAGTRQHSASSPFAMVFFDSVISLITKIVKLSREVPMDGEYVSHVISSILSDPPEESQGTDALRTVLERITDERRSTLESFVDQARWRSNIVQRMLGQCASWQEIFKILHATPVRLLQICKSYNEYGLCDETVKKYSIPESEASSVQLAEWIDGLATRVSVDGMITGMITDKSAVDEFETYVESCKMGDMEKLFLYLDVGTAVATSQEISLQMLSNAKEVVDKIEVTGENKLILALCEKVLLASSDWSGGEMDSVPKRISSANVAKRGPELGAHVKAVQMLAEALQCSKDGKRQFLSGVLHNICTALSEDSCIERETFKGRLNSVSMLLPLLGESGSDAEDPPKSLFLSSFISYLAHIGDAIASIDNQDTYNHFNLLVRDPRDILMYILFERKDPEIASRIAKLLHTNLIDEVLKACVPQVFPPLSGYHSKDGHDAISKRDWDKNILVLKSLVEKSPLRIALACLFISYRESGQESDILSFALEQLSSYPTLHRWIKIQFFIQQMKARITNESSEANPTVLDANFEMEHSKGALEGCLWEDVEVYRNAINRITSNGKLQEAMLLSDRCFQEGSPDSLLVELISLEESKGGDVVFDLALRVRGEEELWSLLQRFKGTWSLDQLILLISKAKSIAAQNGEIFALASKSHRELELYKLVLLTDASYGGDWREVQKQCGENTEALLKRLSELGAHKLVSEIAKEFSVTGEILSELEGEALLACLSQRSIDGGGMPGVMRQLSAMDLDHSLSVAFFALRSAKDVVSKKVFLSFLLSDDHRQRMHTALAAESVSYISEVKIGIKILDELSHPLAAKYEGLVEKPALILENLIISLEIPIAKTICSLYPELMSNKRIAFYAYKACCFDDNVEKGKSDNEAPNALPDKNLAFPMLAGRATDESTRNSYHYKIAPSIPLCESILELSPSTEAAALNSALVAMRLCISFLNRDLEKGSRRGIHSILGDLERTETILEITDKAQEYFESAFSEKALEFEGWDSIWESGLSDGSSYNFDLFEVYSELVASSESGNDGGGGTSLQDCLRHIVSFAVRLDLIHTLLSHEIAISFSKFSSKDSIREAIDFIMEEEHYNIAIFVSKKFGLDPSRIWEEWGIGLLNLSEYREARVKLERAIKSADPDPGVASRIALHAVETLEKGSMVNVNKIYDATHKLLQEKNIKTKGWFGFKEAGKGPSKTIFRNFSSSQIESEVYNECIYFIKKFAPESLLGFYFKHKQYQKACTLAVESKSTAHIEALTKACVQHKMEDFLVDFFKLELSKNGENKEVILELMSHAIQVVSEIKCYSLAYHLQMLNSRGTLAAVLALRTFKECDTKEDAEFWLQNTMEQILNVSGKEQHESFGSLGIECGDLGIANLLEMRSIVGLQIDVIKFAEKQGTDFKSWDVVGSNDMIAFHRRRCAELLLLRDGNLAFRLIQEFRLQAPEVYIDAIRLFCKNKKQIGSLIPLVKDLKGTLGDLEWDHVIGSAFFMLLNECNDRSRAKQMMKLLVSDHSKILAQIALGKLEKAFELAKSCADDVDVELIMRHARSKGNQSLVAKCEGFLRR